MPDERPGIAIVGPTASGKTRLAIALALRFGGEIISCDALQVYRGMDIGTAKASPGEQRQVRHHLLDIQDPDRDFTAGDYQRIGREIIRRLHEHGVIPFVVGGSGFYLRALIDGLFDGPARDEALRERMRRIIGIKGAPVLHRALHRVDPQSAARVSKNDAERIIRAYEIHLVSGKTMSWWQSQPRDFFTGCRWLRIGVNLPREELYRRIDKRVEEMFQAGFVEEVQRLLKKHDRTAHAFTAIGYRQIVDHLEGRASLEQAISETQKQSRRYAKRQLTWFRAEQNIVWLDGLRPPDEVEREAALRVSEFLDGARVNPQE